MTRPKPVHDVRSSITTLLAELPPESLTVVEQFVRFLHEQAQSGLPVVTVQETGAFYEYPTIAAPPSSLDGWMNLVMEGYEGDALVDTEALYDEGA